MRKILVPTDFSVEASNALDVAIQIAERNNTEIILLTIIETLIPPTLENVPEIESYKTKSGKIQDLKEALLNYMKSSVQKEYKTKVKISYDVQVGHPFLSMHETVKSQDIDLVVMGSKGSSGIRQFLVGSNAERMVRHSNCPVLVIKEKSDLTNVEKVVFATDLSLSNDVVLQKLLMFLEGYNVTIHILKVNTHSNWIPDKKVSTQISEFANRNGVKKFIAATYNAEYLEDGIIEYTERIDADMIALATHGRTGLAHLIAGSVAENLSNHVKRPIWTLSLSHDF